MHYFAAPLNPVQQTTHSLRAGQYKRSKKRKRDEDADDEEDPPINRREEAQAPVPSSNTPAPSSAALSLAGADISQRRVAGLLPEDEAEIPPSPFPHAPARISKDNFTYTNLQQRLASLDPPLFALNATSKSDPVDRPGAKPALRQTHLGILSTILHHCLLQGDYHRAGRTWGMILRTQIAGKPYDLRSNDRWGIGAELLLRQNMTPGEDMFTPEGFEQARAYYERLIIQHPNRKHHPNAIDDTIFYSAIFSLWIYEVCENSKRARRRMEEDHHDDKSADSVFDDDSRSVSSQDARKREDELRNEELRQAREIWDRLDQLIRSPPFDKRTDLLQLRGMVALWKADLIMGEDSLKSGNEWEEPVEHEYDTDPAKRDRYSQARRELHEARSSFARAQENGAPSWQAIKDVEARIRRLEEKSERLEKSQFG